MQLLVPFFESICYWYAAFVLCTQPCCVLPQVWGEGSGLPLRGFWALGALILQGGRVFPRGYDSQGQGARAGHYGAGLRRVPFWLSSVGCPRTVCVCA